MDACMHALSAQTVVDMFETWQSGGKFGAPVVETRTSVLWRIGELAKQLHKTKPGRGQEGPGDCMLAYIVHMLVCI